MYETNADQIREAELARTIERDVNIELKKLPARYFVDAVAVRDDKPVAWFEFKVRNMKYGQYAQILLSFKKHMEALRLVGVTGLPFVYVVRMIDGDYFVTLPYETDLRVGFWHQAVGGQEFEPCVFIPLTEFRPLADLAKVFE